MSKKYVFVGSHGVGKSSASHYLAAVLKEYDRSKSVTVLDENVREIARLTKGELNNEAFQKLAFCDHLTKEFTAELLYDQIVCDRSCLDTLIYGIVYKVKLPGEYFSLALNHLNSFSHVFFVRPDSDFIVNDNFRDTNLEIRNQVDEEFERMLALWGGKYTTITTKDVFKFDYIKHLGLNNENN